jgi:hypothetical protein
MYRQFDCRLIDEELQWNGHSCDALTVFCSVPSQFIFPVLSFASVKNEYVTLHFFFVFRLLPGVRYFSRHDLSSVVIALSAPVSLGVLGCRSLAFACDYDARHCQLLLLSVCIGDGS